MSLSNAELAALIEPLFARTKVLHGEHTQGGLSNTNIRVKLYDRKTPVLLRLFTRDAAQARKEFMLNGLIHGSVPTPKFLYFSEDNPVTGHPYAILEYIDAPRLELVATKLDPKEYLEIGAVVGEVMASIHNHTFRQTGFFDNKLAVTDPAALDKEGLLEFAELCLVEKGGRDRIGQTLYRILMDFIEEFGAILDTWKGPACLAHSDFGPSNILVAKNNKKWQVEAVLDWEFAFSGSPFVDFGNFLRPGWHNVPVDGLASAVAMGYVAAGGRLPPNWQELMKMTDLFAWLDFVSRPSISPQHLEDTKAAMADTVRVFSTK